MCMVAGEEPFRVMCNAYVGYLELMPQNSELILVSFDAVVHALCNKGQLLSVKMLCKGLLMVRL